MVTDTVLDPKNCLGLQITPQNLLGKAEGQAISNADFAVLRYRISVLMGDLVAHNHCRNPTLHIPAVPNPDSTGADWEGMAQID